MGWVDIKDKDGKVIGRAIVCGGRERVKPCKFCDANGRWRNSTKLCDFPVGDGKTCDAPMCHRHATSVGPDLDYCPHHKMKARD